MTAYTDTLGFNKGTADVLPDTYRKSLALVEVELDFAEIIAARSAASATALAAADSLAVLRIPAKCAVLSAGAEVTSAETANTTCTFDVGFTGGDVDAYVDGLASNALGSAANATDSVAYKTAADTLDVLILTAAPTDCVLRVWAIVVDCS